jgi:hypothetical protein
LELLSHQSVKKDDGDGGGGSDDDNDDTPGLTGTLSGSPLGRVALRKEQWERLKINLHEN